MTETHTCSYKEIRFTCFSKHLIDYRNAYQKPQVTVKLMKTTSKSTSITFTMETRNEIPCCHGKIV